MKSKAEKLSISLPSATLEFVKEYQLAHAYKSRSNVFQDALKLLRKKELESQYEQANLEIDPDFDALPTNY